MDLFTFVEEILNGKLDFWRGGSLNFSRFFDVFKIPSNNKMMRFVKTEKISKFYTLAVCKAVNIVLYKVLCKVGANNCFTLSWQKSLSYKNQFIDLLCKSKGWFLYGRDLRHERVTWKLL